MGLFPTKPDPRTAVSLDVLEMFHCFSTTGTGGFSKQGFALGLKNFHRFKLRKEPLSRYEELFRSCIPFYLRVRRARDESIQNALNQYWRSQWEQERVTNGTEDPISISTSTAITQPSTLQATAGSVLPATGIDTDAAHIANTPSLPDTNATPHTEPPFVLRTGAFHTICPACFYRTSPADTQPVVIAIDGNFQHSRWGHVGQNSVDIGSDTPLFYHVPSEMQVHTNDEKDAKDGHVAGTICEHNFKATSKPRTMELKDETGLLMVVCR